MKITYDREFSRDVLDLFVSDGNGAGVASSLVAYARHARFPVDLQFRREAHGNRVTATLYVGLTAVLNLHMSSKGLWMSVHKTHQKNGGFDQAGRCGVPKRSLERSGPTSSGISTDHSYRSTEPRPQGGRRAGGDYLVRQ